MLTIWVASFFKFFHINLVFTDDNFSNMQKNFLEKYWQTFENSEENKLCYMDIFQEYVSVQPQIK